MYEKVEKLKDFGRVRAGVDWHDQMGWNFKFTDLQAVLGQAQMKKLSQRIRLKKNIFALYQKYLAGVGQVKFISTNLKEVSPWFIDVLIPDPLALQNYLKSKNIGSRVFYPAIHAQPVYRNIRGDFSVATNIAKHGLWLPSSAFLKKENIKYICDCIRQFYQAN